MNPGGQKRDRPPGSHSLSNLREPGACNTPTTGGGRREGSAVLSPLPLTTGVEEALPRAHLRVLLCQPPLGPAEALSREQEMTAALDKLLQQLCGAAGQNHVVAGQGKGSLFLSPCSPFPCLSTPDPPYLSTNMIILSSWFAYFSISFFSHLTFWPPPTVRATSPPRHSWPRPRVCRKDPTPTPWQRFSWPR